ncbi:MAG: GntR family transcriptional regulator [Betaproteobacteria bacterium]
MSEKLKETLEERIVTGKYLPGMRLDETELATEFAVSRTPVREALIQLAFYGLIEMRPRRGAIVTELSHQRLYEMFEVMAELEGMSARLAARRHTDTDLKAIQEAQAACDQAFVLGDVDNYYHENERFHMAVYAASHNSFLIEKATSLFRRLGAYRRLQLRIRGRLKSSKEEHAEVIEALIAGNGELAAEHLQKHVIVQGELFSDLIASMSNQGMFAKQN